MRLALAFLLALALMPIAAADPVEVATDCEAGGLRAVVNAGATITAGVAAEPACVIVTIDPSQLP